jgi:glycogen operon protein
MRLSPRGEVRASSGSPYPLGARWDGEGVNFALLSEHATGVDLCLFEHPYERTERARIPLVERTGGVWHAYLPDVRPGQLYGYRVFGPYEPEKGHRFNPRKLLLDPYAKAIAGRIQWRSSFCGYRIGAPDEDLSLSDEDSAGELPKCVVTETAFSWGDDRRPNVPWSQTVIYECHVKGLTIRHPGVPEDLRGTYLGLASEPVLDHLSRLGVTAVELLPVQHSVTERALVERGLTNYWGYNTVGFFAPDSRYARSAFGAQVGEFKSMVKALHRAGIEVILDVAYNHTGEHDHLGPTICFRGIDNRTYYRLADKPRYYSDFTGCGNSLNLSHPRCLQLVLDSLRYWVEEMHVDGFRFDLATTLGRDPVEFNRAGRFFATVQQDPVLANVKLIAEPWDVGPGGYQQGGFPVGWAEWNGRYRDAVRRFWRGDAGQVPELASRISGSSDLFQASDRGPHASVNFVTCHDGFTLADLVSYERKRNEPNGEANRDGADENWSRSWGVEGETESLRVLHMRERARRNLFATLAFSQGVVIISHGDELGRTQRGNNNAYCQDNETSWVEWELDERRRELLEFVRHVLQIRRSNPVFRRRRFFAGDPVTREGAKDVSWIRADGSEMEPSDWHDPRNRVLGTLIHGNASDELDERGRPNRGATLLLLLNASGRSRYFRIPPLPEVGIWRELVNTARPGARVIKEDGVNLVAHSLLLLQHEVPR